MESCKPPYPDGRVQFDEDSVRYYSPNSTVDTPLNHNPLPKDLNNPFLPGRTGSSRVRYRDFVHPRPWKAKFGWTAFVPVVPTQWFDHHTYFGRVLSRFPYMEHFTNPEDKKHGWVISQDNAWCRLEKDVYDAVVALSGHYHVPLILPFLPNAIGYTQMYSQKRVLISRLEEARNWFFVWFGALSYLVRHAKDLTQGSSQEGGDEAWINVLHSRGVAPGFTDALVTSLIVERDMKIVRRAGTILTLSDNDRPTVESMIHCGIPVWYRWSHEEEKDTRARRYRPPQHLLQIQPPPVASRSVTLAHLERPQSTPPIEPPVNSPLSAVDTSSLSSANHGAVAKKLPFVTTPRGHHQVATQSSPTSPMHVPDEFEDGEHPTISSTSNIPMPDSITPASREATKAALQPEWIAFFASREAAHAQILKVETPEARRRRESRTREPATASAKVFEWWESEKEGTLYKRIPVLGKAKLDTLWSYGRAQRRYDPFFNEWDCCSQFGEDDEDEDYGEDKVIPANHNDDIPVPAIPSDIASSFVRATESSSSAPSHIDADRPTDVFLQSEAAVHSGLEGEINETLTYFYGFAHPVPGGPAASASYNERDKIFLLRVLGADVNVRKDLPYFNTEHYRATQGFLQSLSRQQDPPIGSSDLRDESIHPVRFTSRFRYIRVVQRSAEDKTDPHDRIEQYYIFDSVEPEIQWKLGVTSASTALLVCRLPSSYTTPDIAAFLSSYGVPFRTFYPIRHRLKQPSIRLMLQHELPKRPFHHVFTKADYDAYVHMRTLILGQPHMQASLKRGGIVWRLAVGTLGTSCIIGDPSLWASSHGVSLSGTHFVDDALTTTEMDLICGAYECVSDDGKQRSLKSWWPLNRYYEKEECGENYGRWTHRREAWYAKRLSDIEEGRNAQKPLTYTEWKSTQHGPTAIRSLHANLERWSSKLLQP